MLVIFIMNGITFTKINTTKRIDTLSAENKTLLDYKRLRVSDYTYLSEEEEEKEEQKQEEKQNKETISVNKFNESIIKKGMDIKIWNYLISILTIKHHLHC